MKRPPAARSLLERDAAVIANIGPLRFSPLSLVGGRGCRLTEEGGRTLLDLAASFGAASLGYFHPAITRAVTAACADMAGASLLSHPNENAVALAEELLRLTPGRGERRVWFGHSGSDANDCALRAVTAATGRSRVISFIGSYHGNLTGSMSISGHTAMTHTLPRPALQTTGGNPVATAAGRAVLQTIADEGLVEHAAKVGRTLTEGLLALAARQPMIGDVRGRGLAVGVELVGESAAHEPVPVETTAKVIFRAYQLGAVFFYVGMRGNVLELTPPLTLSVVEAEEGIDMIGRAIAGAAQGLVSDADVAPYMMW